MRSEHAAAVISMAGELAAAVGDPEPVMSELDFVRAASGPERWFDCLIAELEGHVVGYAVLCKGFEAHTGHKRMWLGDLYVRPAVRNRGVGRTLIASIARHALKLGCDAVYWELWRPNKAGAAFYRKIRAEQVEDLAVMRIDRTYLETVAGG